MICRQLGIVYEDVEPAEAVDRLGDDGSDAVSARGVKRHRADRAAETVGTPRPADRFVGDDDMRAFADELGGRCGADARSAPDYDGNLSR
jgi:hypothetical protein